MHTAHTVLGSADGAAYGSLLARPVPRQERWETGRALRERVHRTALAGWEPADDRADVVEQVQRLHEGRLDRLVPVRVARMVASPFGFLRGAAGVMADDFASLPSTGITPVICGDAHVGNIGFYGSPSRDLVLDLNDFDEAHPGPWEWDLRRLAASIWVAGRSNGLSETACSDATAAAVRAYRKHVRDLSQRPLMARSFETLDVDSLHDEASDPALHAELERASARAARRTSDRALPKLTEQRDGQRRIALSPPLVTAPEDDEVDLLPEALDGYLATLPPHWARMLGGYTLVDIAHKAVGVGSVGLRAYVALLEGSDPDDVVFLQLKQARRSVIAPHVHGDSAWHDHQGRRVVEYQQALQTVSDPLLGWATVGKNQYYVRQLRNMKGSVALDGISAGALEDYAGICGRLLAKGHARTSGASMIAGYLGSSDKVEVALCAFARRYADQTEADHAALVRAVEHGRLPTA